MSFRYRIDYAKNNNMRYTSNLDIHKMWERTFRRAKLPLLYSQGFHPQPKIQQASPLPLGFLSRNEIVDFILTENLDINHLQELLSSSLPSGIEINGITQIELKTPALQTLSEASEYLIYFLDEFNLEKVKEDIADLLSKSSIQRIRRGKTYDLRPLVLELELVRENKPFIKMLLKSRESATGRPEEVLHELNIPVELTRIIRNKIILSEIQ